MGNTKPIAPVKSSIKIPSLNDVKNRVNNPVQEEEKEQKKEAEPTETLNREFNVHELRRHWKAFADLPENKGNISITMIVKNKEPELEGNVIKVGLDNIVQQEQIIGFKERLMQYLRGVLQNSGIVLEATVVEVERGKMLYTQQEKFNFLLEEHPKLKELKDKLGLDTDY